MPNLLALAILSLLCTAALADELNLHGNLEAARGIVKADLDFGVLAKKEGAAKAFRDAMDATDGTVFAGGSQPAIGSDAIYAKMGGDAPDESTLEWHPVEAFAAKSGDMGVTRGHWTATSKTDAGKSAGGSYVTVWRKNAKGEWKGLIDIGAADKPKQ